MSHGIRTMDVAWQAFQAGANGEASEPLGLGNIDGQNAEFMRWWAERERQGCAMPTCPKCGHDPGPTREELDLSPRQLEIGKLLASGMRCPEIAVDLGIALKTAEVHRVAVLKRTNCANTVELAHLFIRLGLVELAPSWPKVGA